MVTNTEAIETKRNGKRSRGSSPSATNNNNPSSKQPAPTTAENLTPETSDDDSHSKKNLGKSKNGKSEYEEKIRVGKDYQVIVPEMGPRSENYADKALLVWSPVRDIPDGKLEEYITLAKERYGYNAEQALGMLFWHKHDLEKAVIDLANFTPFPDEWTKEDKVLFEQAFQFHGKCFHRIRQMLPDKSIASLVKFYYSWKKTRSRTSVMDRQEKKKNEGGSENGSENGSHEGSDVEDKKWPIRGIRRTQSSSPSRLQPSMNSRADSVSSSSAPKSLALKAAQDLKRFGTPVNGKGVGGAVQENNKDTGYSSSSSSSNGASKLSSLNCQNCTVLCDALKSSPVGSFCLSCFHHWRRTGVMRPTQGPHNMGIGTNQRPQSKSNKLYYFQGYHDGSSKYKKKPPKGMYINHDDVEKLAAQDLQSKKSPNKLPGVVSRKNDLLAEVEHEISVLHGQIQTNKQKISSLKDANEKFHDGRSIDEVTLSRANQRWTKDEVSLAMIGFRKFGQSFKDIAEVLGTKTESHVRKFFAKYRKSRDLDLVCQQSRSLSDDGVKQVESIEIMEIDSDDDVQQVKDADIMGNINEIIGVAPGAKKETEEANKTPGKTSIMTTSTGKTLKRKHDDDVVKVDADDACLITDDAAPVKKIAIEKIVAETKSEITITPIRKPSADADKTNGKESSEAPVSVEA